MAIVIERRVDRAKILMRLAEREMQSGPVVQAMRGIVQQGLEHRQMRVAGGAVSLEVGEKTMSFHIPRGNGDGSSLNADGAGAVGGLLGGDAEMIPGRSVIRAEKQGASVGRARRWIGAEIALNIREIEMSIDMARIGHGRGPETGKGLSPMSLVTQQRAGAVMPPRETGSDPRNAIIQLQGLGGLSGSTSRVREIEQRLVKRGKQQDGAAAVIDGWVWRVGDGAGGGANIVQPGNHWMLGQQRVDARQGLARLAGVK